MRLSFILCSFTIVVGACDPPQPGKRRGDIIYGEIDEGDPAIVALLKGGAAYCTGTVIAPRVVATAAHCLVQSGAVVLPEAIAIGTRAATPDRTIAVTWAEPHPSWNARYYFGDAALVGLAEDAGVEPVAIRRAPLDEVVGDELRFVGYGVSVEGGQGETGTKMMGAAPLDHVTPEFAIYGQVTCSGDSGGPALAIRDGREELVGITSHGPRYCADLGDSYSTRVDTIAGWIDERLDGHGTCEADRRCTAGCATDPDCRCVADGRCDACDNATDPDCTLARAGAACEGSGSCESGAFCVDGRCALACDPVLSGVCSSEEECAAGTEGEEREVCLPIVVPDTGGCGVAGGGGVIAGLAIGAAIARRRRLQGRARSSAGRDRQ